MIIYASDKSGFNSDILSNDIEAKILTLMRLKSRNVGAHEISSWRNSLLYVNNVLQDKDIPDQIGVSIEYHIPNSAKRIDLILAGSSSDKKECLLIIELKQWSEAKKTDKPSVVSTHFQHGEKEVAHPSYQSWSYAQLLKDFNAVIQDEDIRIAPCAYLHNYKPDGVINGDFYREDLERAPLFLQPDALKLREFIKSWVRYPDTKNLLYRIDNGKIRPSKGLTEHISSLLSGNQEFVLIDEQKIAYETALNLLNRKTKQVFIIEGGPGTGKSVVAINLLVEILKRGKLCQYVTKNGAPRAVYEAKLVGSMKKSQISNLFVGSGAFLNAKKNEFDCLVIDEAHRLNERSGLFSNLGENQIKELIRSSRVSIFLIDECQKVTIKDIGTKAEIRKWAAEQDAAISEITLASQFRCNGSDGYLSWLDNTLQIRETATPDLLGIEYDFRVFDSPSELAINIETLNRKRNRARLVAGYCWDWKSKTDSSSEVFDIEMPEFRFRRRWNLAKDGGLWILEKESVSEVGCIHTCQGLELDYVGVIIGPDLVVRNGRVVTDFRARSKMDQSLKGIKALAKESPDKAAAVADEIIKNTYRTLMTRGMKGCFVFCADRETREYLESSAVEFVRDNHAGFTRVAEAEVGYE